jgi:hypothetical protein
MRSAFAVAMTAAWLLTQSHLAWAAVPLGPDFPPKGEVRIATLTADNPINTTATQNTGLAPVPGLALPISIPRGKVADVTILFTGVVNSPDALLVSAVVDGFSAAPGVVQAFFATGGGATSQGVNFETFLFEGDHTIEMRWGGVGGQQFMRNRSMTVIVNLRRRPAAVL